MLINVHLPAYHAAGKDYPVRYVTVKFPGLPPIGYQMTVLAEVDGIWGQYVVSIDNVRVDPGWTPLRTGTATVAQDNRDCGFMNIEAWTSWVHTPGRSRGR